ncbi:MAG: anhydro-N-acetylmuramic acid kinase [Alphaproteobacteria bacterium]|nr:anhydro-N-acetylmuramic acid kinase [Alphaproteobacteria bacterium]
MTAIGMMSGTSLDGVDAALVRTDGVAVAPLGAALTLPYAPGLRARLRALLDTAPQLAPDAPSVAEAARTIAEHHAEAVAALLARAGLDRAAVAVLGFHGQTILHRPEEHRTWQIGDAMHLAARTGIPVVSDFRSADMAAGGEGAPLAPLYHAARAAGLARPLAVLNIGGVANLTWIGPGGPEDLIACDTGPGNGPLDDWVMRHTGRAYDDGGALAAAGRVDQAVLGRLMAHPFFARRPPKSLDRLDFSRALAASGIEALGPADGAATLVAFTAAAVRAALAHLPAPPVRWLVTGGGRHNPALMAALRAALCVPVDPVEAEGWDGDALEAECFGYLAVRSLAGLALSLPGTTGAARAVSGGILTRPPAPGG